LIRVLEDKRHEAPNRVGEADAIPLVRSSPIRGTRIHSLGDYANRQALQLRQNVAPEIHAIERPIITPRDRGLALLRG